MLHKIIRRAGFEPWPRAWNNLRASRATELAEDFPGHVAAAWLGHTEEIADAHYRQVLPSHFDKATQNPTQTATEIEVNDVKQTESYVVRPLRENEKAPEFPGLSVPCQIVQGMTGGGGGLSFILPACLQAFDSSSITESLNFLALPKSTKTTLKLNG